MSNGFVRIPRRLFDTSWWNKRRAFSESDAVIDLYKSVNVRDRTEPDGTKVLKNQFVTSNRTLADRWYWPPMKVNRFLKKLEDDGYLRLSSSRYKTIITIIDFGIDSDKSGTRSDTLSDTQGDTPSDTPKPLYTKGLHGVSDTPTDTLSDTRSGTPSDTYNKNIRKEENNTPLISPLESGENTKNIKRFIKPTIEEIEAYSKSKGYTFSAEQFYYFYESKGWKVGNQPMKSWQAACVTWQRRQPTQRDNTRINNSPQKIWTKL